MLSLPLTRLSASTGWRADVAALCGGALAAGALPPTHLVPVLLLSVPLLLRLIAAAPGPLAAARRGWWFGFGLNAIGLYWITEAILIEAARFWWLVPIAVPALAAVLAVFVALPAALAKLARPGWCAALALSGGWVLADLARQFVATGFPWNPLGSVWAFPGTAGDIMIQAAAVVGVHGMTLGTLLLAATPVMGWVGRAGGALLLVAWCGFGVARLDLPLPPPPGVSVYLVQGNVAQGQKWDRALARSIFRRYLDLTRQASMAAGGKPAVIVWPETASPALLQTDQPAREAIADAAGGAWTLAGSVRFNEADRPLNSLIAIDPDGAIAAIYDKWHLVPFGEYQPDWLPGIQIVPGGGFAAGPGPLTLHLPGLPPVGALICYEAIFSGQVVDRSDRPKWLVNVTNDAWFGNSSGPRQHLAAVRLRAVEAGLPLMRAANTGISAAFDPRGHELGRLDLSVTGVLPVAMTAALPPTVYSRAGLLLPAALSGFVILLGFGSRLRTNRR